MQGPDLKHRQHVGLHLLAAPNCSVAGVQSDQGLPYIPPYQALAGLAACTA